MRLGSAVVVVAACGRIGFGSSQQLGGDGRSGDGAADGTIVSSDGMSSGCIEPGDGDAFTASQPCAGWGTLLATSASVTVAPGALAIAPDANQTPNGVATPGTAVFASVNVCS